MKHITARDRTSKKKALVMPLGTDILSFIGTRFLTVIMYANLLRNVS